MKTNLIVILLVLSLIGTNAYWAFLILNQGVTQTYTEASVKTAQKQYEQAIVLSNLQLTGLSSKKAIVKIEKDVYGLVPFVKDGCIWAGSVCILLEDDKVSKLSNEHL